jgi:hypothetical protein
MLMEPDWELHLGSIATTKKKRKTLERIQMFGTPKLSRNQNG